MKTNKLVIIRLSLKQINKQNKKGKDKKLRNIVTEKKNPYKDRYDLSDIEENTI